MAKKTRFYSKDYKAKPLVTIGLCVKNNESTIRGTVNSITVQNFPHELIEIIVIDKISMSLWKAIILTD